MIFTSARDLAFQHLAYVLGCHPTEYEIDAVVERVARRADRPKQLERLAREEATQFVRAPS